MSNCQGPWAKTIRRRLVERAAISSSSGEGLRHALPGVAAPGSSDGGSHGRDDSKRSGAFSSPPSPDPDCLKVCGRLRRRPLVLDQGPPTPPEPVAEIRKLPDRLRELRNGARAA